MKTRLGAAVALLLMLSVADNGRRAPIPALGKALKAAAEHIDPRAVRLRAK